MTAWQCSISYKRLDSPIAGGLCGSYEVFQKCIVQINDHWLQPTNPAGETFIPRPLVEGSAQRKKAVEWKVSFQVNFRVSHSIESANKMELVVVVISGLTFYWSFDIKHLMTGPEGNSEFCFPRISMFPETKSMETLRNKIHFSPRDQSLSDSL